MKRIALSALLICLFPISLLAQNLESDVSPPALKMNQIQAVGTHNSYKIAIPAAEMKLIAGFSKKAAISLDYSHKPLVEQLDLGMRQLELDVLYDPKGGRYANPGLAKLTKNKEGSSPYDASAMHAPGYKVLHAQDVDVRSHCPTFVLCLRQIDAWSKAHPNHVPLLILVNAKDGASAMPLGVRALDYDSAAYDALDAEIRNVLSPERLITPDDVRGNAATLREAVLAGGWPTLDAARGKIFFALDEPPAKVALYRRGRASLEGLVMFVNTFNEADPDAAYFTINHPVRQFDRINRLIEEGYIVRTRADSEPAEARANDPARFTAALSSGAQYISTDYPTPRADFGPYFIQLPGGMPARPNPVSVPSPKP